MFTTPYFSAIIAGGLAWIAAIWHHDTTSFIYFYCLGVITGIFALKVDFWED